MPNYLLSEHTLELIKPLWIANLCAVGVIACSLGASLMDPGDHSEAISDNFAGFGVFQ